MSTMQGDIKGAYLENLNNPSSLPVGDISNALEIIQDWSTIPFVAIEAVNPTDGIPEKCEPIFHREWPGLEEGCDQDEIVAWSDTPNRKGCGSGRIPGHPPVNQTILNDVILCGIRSEETSPLH